MVFKKSSGGDNAVYAQIRNPLMVRKEMLLVVLGAAKMIKRHSEYLYLQERKSELRKEFERVNCEMQTLLNELKHKYLPQVKEERKIAVLEEHKDSTNGKSKAVHSDDNFIRKEIQDIEDKIKNL